MGRARQPMPAVPDTRSDLDLLLEAEQRMAMQIAEAEAEAQRMVAEASRDAARRDADEQQLMTRCAELAEIIQASTERTLAAEERAVASEAARLDATDAARLHTLADLLVERVLATAERRIPGGDAP